MPIKQSKRTLNSFSVIIVSKFIFQFISESMVCIYSIAADSRFLKECLPLETLHQLLNDPYFVQFFPT